MSWKLYYYNAKIMAFRNLFCIMPSNKLYINAKCNLDLTSEVKNFKMWKYVLENIRERVMFYLAMADCDG